MRIAFVISDSIDEMWGHRTHILEVQKELGRRANVHLFLPRPTSFVMDGDGVFPVPTIAIPVIGLVIRQMALICRLLIDAPRFQPEIIYARQSPFSIAPLLAACCLRIPLVIELNGLMAEDLRAEQVAAPIIHLAVLNESLNCRHATSIVAVSEGIATEVASRHGRSDATVIANGVDCMLFLPTDRTEALRVLALDPYFSYICFVGNLAPWQGLAYLIEAMATVIRRCPLARLLIVGVGEQESALRQKVQDIGLNSACIFIGGVPHAKVPMFISAATVCVAPFERRRNEKTGLSPLKIYEYMSCSRPIVSSAVPGVSELINDSKGGVLVPPEDVDALANALIERLSDLPGSEMFGKNGRRYVIAGHCWSHVADRILVVLENARKQTGR